MKANEDKCHILLSINGNVLANIGTPQIQYSSCKKLLEIKIDSNLNFKDYIGSTFKKGSVTFIWKLMKPSVMFYYQLTEMFLQI